MICMEMQWETRQLKRPLIWGENCRGQNLWGLRSWLKMLQQETQGSGPGCKLGRLGGNPFPALLLAVRMAGAVRSQFAPFLCNKLLRNSLKRVQTAPSPPLQRSCSTKALSPVAMPAQAGLLWGGHWGSSTGAPLQRWGLTFKR